uniref:Uncharacterized protein n=1 Tax=Chrysotila carterae TaxID=13221 RepID=A0A7S4BVU0_CHRCT
MPQASPPAPLTQASPLPQASPPRPSLPSPLPLLIASPPSQLPAPTLPSPAYPLQPLPTPFFPTKPLFAPNASEPMLPPSVPLLLLPSQPPSLSPPDAGDIDAVSPNTSRVFNDAHDSASGSGSENDGAAEIDSAANGGDLSGDVSGDAGSDMPRALPPEALGVIVLCLLLCVAVVLFTWRRACLRRSPPMRAAQLGVAVGEKQSQRTAATDARIVFTHTRGALQPAPPQQNMERKVARAQNSNAARRKQPPAHAPNIGMADTVTALETDDIDLRSLPFDQL